MERAAWTDERLDDLARRVDVGFERVDNDLREVRGELAALRTTIIRVGGAMIAAIMTGSIGAIAAIVAGG